MNPKASQVANELRRIADALDREPDTEVETPMVSFYCNNYLAKDRGKQVFLNVLRLLPRPLVKDYSETEVKIRGAESDVVNLRACIDRSAVCEIVEPAKPAVYHCVPLLSDQEEASLGKL